MTFQIKLRGSADRPIAAEYLCPVHGRFVLTVERDEHGDPPGEAACPGGGSWGHCAPGKSSPFVISAPLVGVRRVEAVKGRWEKPEKKTFLDTRNLGEGQDLDEWRQSREGVWDERRKQDLKELMS